MNLQEKISLAQLLEKMQVDVEVSYPGNSQKDFDKLLSISKLIKESIVCGLARTNKEEILKVAEAIKPASRGRINTYTLVNIKE
jgi:2-isopropylmalate synthase